jgi:hypothetical protein
MRLVSCPLSWPTFGGHTSIVLSTFLVSSSSRPHQESSTILEVGLQQHCFSCISTTAFCGVCEHPALQHNLYLILRYIETILSTQYVRQGPMNLGAYNFSTCRFPRQARSGYTGRPWMTLATEPSHRKAHMYMYLMYKSHNCIR